MAVTARQAAQALETYRKNIPVAVTRGLRRALRKAQAFATTKYMQRGDNRHPKVWDPPNPPPGPLKIRQANLARTVKITDIKVQRTKVIGGLQAGNSNVRYAGHEFGMRAGRGRNVIIPARPYMTPALEDPNTKIEEEVLRELRKLAVATLRGVARVRPA